MTIKVACLQLEAFDINQSDLALENAFQMIDRVAGSKVDLVVLPECVFPGYILGLHCDIEAQVKKTSKALNAFQEKAREHSLHLIVGLAELYKEKIQNTAVLINPKGKIVGRTAKSFLWHFDSKWFESGDTFEVFQTDIGRIGMIVCADGRQPEITRILSLKGADVIVDLTNLVSSGFYPDNLSNPQCEYMLTTRALENRVWLIVANKVGIEAKSVVYCGRSCVIDPAGSVLKMASSHKQEIVSVEIDLSASRMKRFDENFDVFSNRRPRAYKILSKEYTSVPLAKYLKEKLIPEEKTFYAGVVQLDKRINISEFIISASEFIKSMALQSTKLLVFPDLPCLENWSNEKQLIESFINNAKENDLFIISAGTQVDVDHIYKGAYLFSPDGSYQFYRKVHLDERENKKFKPGEEMIVWETSIGRIAIMLGYEGLLPEVARSLTLMGADIIAWPVNFSINHQKSFARTRASENRIFVMVANTFGLDSGGNSLITNPLGLLPAAAFQGREQAVGTQMEILLVRCKDVVPGSNVIKDRFPRAYNLLWENSV